MEEQQLKQPQKFFANSHENNNGSVFILAAANTDACKESGGMEVIETPPAINNSLFIDGQEGFLFVLRFRLLLLSI